MSSTLRWFLVFFLASSALLAQTPAEAQQAAEAISWDEYWSRLTYLASDELGGRDVGSAGFDQAAHFAADVFQTAGLLPFGDDSSYFQHIPFKRAALQQSGFRFAVGRDSELIQGANGQDVSILINTDSTVYSVAGQFVFAGFGNVIPEAGIDDYSGIDATGKIVIAAIGNPKGLADSLQSGMFHKLDVAEEHGAIGMLLFMPRIGFVEKAIFKRFSGYLSRPRFFIDEPGMDFSRTDLDLAMLARKSFVKLIFKQNDLRLGKLLRKMKHGVHVSTELSSNLDVRYELAVEETPCKNVVAWIPGSDSLLQDEFIVVGGHLDHLGTGEVVKGDSIFNGFWDNASGSAAVLSIAEAFAGMPAPNRRSLLFVLYTGEEKGLFGSQYLANTCAMDSIDVVANINIDMLGGPVETTDFSPAGYSHSNLSEAVDFAAETTGLTISDASTNEHLYMGRSDQAAFLKKGIPVLFIESGTHAADGKTDVEKVLDKWMKKRYHSRDDDAEQPFSHASLRNHLKLQFLTTWYVANRMDEIRWEEGSWIYDSYVEKEEPTASPN